MPTESHNNSDHLEEFYRSNATQHETAPSSGLYDSIGERMIPLNKMAIRQRRNKRILYASLAVNAVLVCVVCWSYFKNPATKNSTENITDKPNKDSTQYHITSPKKRE